MIIGWIMKWVMKFRLKRYIKRGLQIADDCRLIGMPEFGSECYLISIGKGVTLASHVSFITHDGGTRIFRFQPRYKDVIKFGRITIHDHCWIGKGVTIMPGVSIGPNSVVGACSVVTKDIPPNTVACGNPARVVKSVEAYAEACLGSNPPYDREAYRANKAEELLRIYPRPW